MSTENAIERRFLERAHARRFALERFLHDEVNGRRAEDVRHALAPIAAAWGRVAAVRSFTAHAARVRLDRPVLCVGSLGVGGSGKTPFVRWLGRRLIEAGRSPAVLTRGYGWVLRSHSPLVLLPQAVPAAGARRQVPDEALLCIRDGLAVGAHPSRARAAAALARSGLRRDVYLLDDGFQHRQLHRDWNLVLVSRRELAAPRRPLPAGPFREVWGALARANRIAITGLDGQAARALAGLGNADLGLPPGEPPVLAGVEGGGLIEHNRLWDRTAEAVEGAGHEAGVAGRSLLAFSGIADPASFERLLVSRGLRVVAHVVFPDHHRYTAVELARLLDMVPPGGALVTTEKDAVRFEPGSLPAGRCWVARAELVFWRGEEALRADLQRLVPGDA